MLLCAVASLSCMQSAQAVLSTFFGEDLNPALTVPAGGNAETARLNFLSNLSGGVGNEDFESFAVGNSVPLALTFPGSTGNITASLTGGGALIDNSTAFGRFNTSPGGSNFLQVNSGQSFSIAFSSPIAAFGFYGTDIGDFSGQLLLTTAGGAVTNLVVPHTVNSPNGALLFYGIIDTTTQYTGLTFTNSGTGGDVFGFDDMVIGDLQQVRNVVPEPITASLGLMGMGVLASATRRRRSA